MFTMYVYAEHSAEVVGLALSRGHALRADVFAYTGRIPSTPNSPKTAPFRAPRCHSRGVHPRSTFVTGRATKTSSRATLQWREDGAPSGSLATDLAHAVQSGRGRHCNEHLMHPVRDRSRCRRRHPPPRLKHGGLSTSRNRSRNRRVRPQQRLAPPTQHRFPPERACAGSAHPGTPFRGDSWDTLGSLPTPTPRTSSLRTDLGPRSGMGALGIPPGFHRSVIRVRSGIGRGALQKAWGAVVGKSTCADLLLALRPQGETDLARQTQSPLWRDGQGRPCPQIEPIGSPNRRRCLVRRRGSCQSTWCRAVALNPGRHPRQPFART